MNKAIQEIKKEIVRLKEKLDQLREAFDAAQNNEVQAQLDIAAEINSTQGSVIILMKLLLKLEETK